MEYAIFKFGTRGLERRAADCITVSPFAAGQLEVTQKYKTPILWGAIKDQGK
jgi:hypothetical protein